MVAQGRVSAGSTDTDAGCVGRRGAAQFPSAALGDWGGLLGFYTEVWFTLGADFAVTPTTSWNSRFSIVEAKAHATGSGSMGKPVIRKQATLDF